MTKTGWPALIASVLVTATFLPTQQTEDESRTLTALTEHLNYKFSNGKTWRDVDHQSRIIWVDGIEEGVMLTIREVHPHTVLADRAVIDAVPDGLSIKGFHMSDVVQQIDRFYSDSSNLRIPVVDAYKYAVKKMHGAKRQELDDYETELRRKFNN